MYVNGCKWKYIGFAVWMLFILSVTNHYTKIRKQRWGLRHKINTQRGKTEAKSYPEDEVEEEKQIFDAFSAAFDSHGERWMALARSFEDGNKSDAITEQRERTEVWLQLRRQHPAAPPPAEVWTSSAQLWPSKSNFRHTFKIKQHICSDILKMDFSLLFVLLPIYVSEIIKTQ